MASSHTQSPASSRYICLKFSWQMGQTLFLSTGSLGTGMYWRLGACAAEPRVPLESPAAATRSSSTVSRLLIQSCRSLVKVRIVSHIQRLTLSSTNQLRCCPLFSASAIRWLTLKCQSICAVFFFLPSSSVLNRLPQCVHWGPRASNMNGTKCGRNLYGTLAWLLQTTT
jgi:hypothetical protein